MQIVIDIKDETYKHCEESGFLIIRQIMEVEKAIKNGIPLPKGHGDLVDRDALESTTIVTDDYSGNEILDVVLIEDLRIAQTIVEADKEGEDGD